MYDVAVIGAGPVGSQIAYRLASLKHKVVVVDKKTDIAAPVCCTGIIGQECIDTLDLPKDVIYRQASGARIFSPSGKRLNIWRPEPQVSIVDRAAFNAFQARCAGAEGAEYLLDSQVTGIQVRDFGVDLELSAEGRTAKSLQARAVVLATGFGSKLAERLGLGKPGDFVMGVQAEVEVKEAEEVEVYLGEELAPGFFAWLAPTSPGRALAGLISRRAPALYFKTFLERLLAEGKIKTAEVEPRFGGIPLRPLLKTYGERLVVVGAAAGQVKPTTGGGVYYGLLCADIAANCLHRALQSDDLSANNLSTYQKEWQKKLGTELRIGYWARKLYERLNDQQVDRIFDIVKSSGIDKALLEAEDLSFDWHSKAILRMISDSTFSQAMQAIRTPFSSKKHG